MAQNSLNVKIKKEMSWVSHVLCKFPRKDFHLFPREIRGDPMGNKRNDTDLTLVFIYKDCLSSSSHLIKKRFTSSVRSMYRRVRMHSNTQDHHAGHKSPHLKKKKINRLLPSSHPSQLAALFQSITHSKNSSVERHKYQGVVATIHSGSLVCREISFLDDSV